MPDYTLVAMWPNGDFCPEDEVTEYMLDGGKSDDYDLVWVDEYGDLVVPTDRTAEGVSHDLR